ncbi:MAG: hypothetical protein A2W93_10875 [Bacteroidetes bacterium GWF2_43_63]|nr:MAG: hypothetical protein A2W94_00265 [Bacteroidetes bacterium GWE2_42_42]OFY56417.1 MAG: hypothetical protein A2W93_10875 [Bacteroidetes bacterium GWF2_43_63]HBG72019.1 hypothetical protein [Bacteroidales bacterium]HCB63027.1 hypothetical protein [Bacteroidales bacterium]HCY23246.1 hypothetical protein [Bacteroidales bacterium]
MFLANTMKYTRTALNVLFWVIVIALFVALFYIFNKPETTFSEIHFTNPFYQFIQQFPDWIYFVFCFIFVSVSFIFIFIARSLYFTIKRERENAQRERYYAFFSYILTNYFLSDYFNTEARRRRLFRKIKPYLKNRSQLTSFIEAHLKIQETLAMDLSVGLLHLINRLQLQKKIESFLYQGEFDDKILAVKIISYLRINSNDKQIMKLARSKNVALRTEAYAALIRLMKNDEYLLNFIGEKFELSMLDINVIVNSVLKNQKVNIDYKALLSSDNINKNKLGLILAKYRYSSNTENTALIAGFIDNSDPVIRKLGWDALLSVVSINEVADLIIERFEKETEEIRLIILQKSEIITNNRISDFLSSVIYSQPLLVKIETLKILFKSDINLLAKFDGVTDDELALAYKEVSCVFIN